MVPSEKPLLLEQTIATINRDDIIVTGADFFFIPKYNGISITEAKTINVPLASVPIIFHH